MPSPDSRIQSFFCEIGNMSALRIGLLGAGKMATALAKGWRSAGLASDFLASDPLEAARTAFAAATGGHVTERNLDVVAKSDLVVLAVKPQMVGVLLPEIAPALTPKHLVVSIVAGVTIRKLAEALGFSRIIRVMPNLPCLIGASASAFAVGGSATPADAATVQRLLDGVGRAIEVPERMLDAVTGLSGSGPAYGFIMIEALADGGVRMGLPRDVATLLAAQTLLGAAKMVVETGLHPGSLKDQVTSPGGTTIAGLHALEVAGIRGALMNAVQAATERAEELGRGV
jgi:pyrroline-5-carboxylate reductase